MATKTVEGILEILPEGFGFLRDPLQNFRITPSDIYVPKKLIQKYGLKEGLKISGQVNKSEGKKSNALNSVNNCNGYPLKKYEKLPHLKSGVSIDPEEPLKLTTGPDDRIGKLLDRVTPVGKGQRGLIVSPPKAGKTTILKHIATAVHQNNPEVRVIALLIDERPEEVTDFQRSLEGVEVFYSSADQDVASHLRITSLTMNMAIREVEFGNDVIILIDSLTRMGRAFNKESYSGGKTLSGGLAVNALEIPRQFFGAARNIENGGSLTIMATILVETGSRMDEVIFQEFKGTGNLELVLSRECAERRLYPAISIRESGTRKEHKILNEDELDASNLLRRKTASLKPWDALQMVLENMV